MPRLMLISLGVVILPFGLVSCGSFVVELATWDPHGELHFTPVGIGSFALVVGTVLVFVGRRRRER